MIIIYIVLVSAIASCGTGVSTQVAQSAIQDSLQSIGETDYSKIMKQYKVDIETHSYVHTVFM